MYLKIYIVVDKCAFNRTMIFIFLLLSGVEVQRTTKFSRTSAIVCHMMSHLAALQHLWQTMRGITTRNRDTTTQLRTTQHHGASTQDNEFISHPYDNSDSVLRGYYNIRMPSQPESLVQSWEG
jgi:hypothetical protein